METQERDAAAISDILKNAYFKNIYEGNANELASVFYPGALLFGDVKGQPYKKTLAEYIDGVAHRQSPKDSGKTFKGEIISVDVVNSIAVAEVKVKMYDFNYHEFLSFHRIDGKWLLVNKMLTDLNV
jgi:putative lumazine-binding protein